MLKEVTVFMSTLICLPTHGEDNAVKCTICEAISNGAAPAIRCAYGDNSATCTLRTCTLKTDASSDADGTGWLSTCRWFEEPLILWMLTPLATIQFIRSSPVLLLAQDIRTLSAALLLKLVNCGL